MKLKVKDPQRCVGCQSCMFACARRTGNGGLGGSCLGVKSVGGMSKGFVVVVCRACENPPCASVCPTKALESREGGGVRLVHSKCIGCKACQDACVIDAIYWNEEEMKPLICIHCGYCTSYCPHGVFEYRKN